MSNTTTLRQLSKDRIVRSKPQAAPSPVKPKVLPRVWLIDPTDQSINLIEEPDFHSLINPEVGADATDYDLDSHTALWASNIDTNEKYCYYIERMGGDFSRRRFSKGLIVSLDQPYWDEETIKFYLRFLSKSDPYQPLTYRFNYEKK